MNNLSLLDLGFFIAETEASPKHVASLLVCKRPAKSTVGFARNLYRDYLTFTDVQAPFNRIITFFVDTDATLAGRRYGRSQPAYFLSQARQG